jgi:hypothetical protein
MADLPKNEKQAPKRVYQAKDDTHLLYAHIPAWLYSQMKRRMAAGGAGPTARRAQPARAGSPRASIPPT